MKHRVKWLLRLAKLKKKRIYGKLSSYVDDKSQLDGNNYLSQGSKVIESHLGQFSYVNYGSVVNQTTVGKYTCIGPQALIGGLGIHPTTRLSTHRMFYNGNNPCWSGYASGNPFVENKRTIIGNDVWIGARVIVLDGVTIGDGAIVASGSIVTKNVENYSIVGGVPAKHIKYRLSSDAVAKILEDPWWNWSESRVKQSVEDGEFVREFNGG